MKKLNQYLLILVAFLAVSCGESKEITSSVEETETTENVEDIVEDNSETLYNGIIRDYTSSEGCSFLIEIDRNGEKILYDPVHLQEEYQRDGLKVQVSFTMSKRPSKCTLAQPIILTKIIG